MSKIEMYMTLPQPELTLRFTTGRRIKLTPSEVFELRQLLGIPMPLPAAPVAPTMPAQPDWSKIT